MISRGLLAVILILFGSMIASLVLPSSTTGAAGCPSGKILTLKPWYDGLQDGDCTIKPPGDNEGEQKRFVWKIILNIVDDLLQIVGYVAVGFVIYGGFIFMTSAGSPDRAALARKTILQAVIGLIIAMMSIGIVNFVKEAII